MNDKQNMETRFLWLDVETTGLDPDTDRILEIGMIATDRDLNPLDAGFHSVIAWDGEPDDFIRRMHGANGLLAECAHPGAPNAFDVWLNAKNYVDEHAGPDVRLIPAGSTIRFDRNMVDSWSRDILATCDHRSLDVSSLLEAFRAWSPHMPPLPPRTTDHRSMRCLRDTLACARMIRGLICETD
ncbi:exonuclease domain-containing protein [Bifidobacterium sp. SO1]|uniref:exonuclease domain-containing protein n=1 Tax=Bifidobacterium sp. SO1 TaxID=2809029 RepID=UPI001F0AB55E|nr:exonuclease domain-containing protein [Bifidobacterium sp. SO1]